MRLYRALLHVLPRSFQAEYGAEMMKDFARLWQQAATPSARAQLGAAGRARFEELFTLDAMVDRTRAVLERAVDLSTTTGATPVGAVR